MKRGLTLLLTVFLALLLTGCVGKYKKISVTSVELESAVPTSLRSCDAVIAVGIRNPAPAFKVKDIEATVKKNGEVFGLVTADPVAIDGKCERVYRIPLQAQLAEGVGVIQLLAAYKGFKPEDFTLDLKARADVVGKVGKTLEYNDVPLSKFLKK
jgi:hypothetical protein